MLLSEWRKFKRWRSFQVETTKRDGSKEMYIGKYIVVATGYYDNPNYMNVPGEELKKVAHYFKEGILILIEM